jgi:hypothetical protein
MERRRKMAKSFACRRTPQGVAVMEDTIEHLRQSVHRMKEEYCRYSPEALETRVVLAVTKCATEDYEPVVPLLSGYVVAEK